jgi:ribosomal protein S18 acetylase RimI-like enzyme
MEPPSIRRATSGDVSAIYKLMVDVFGETSLPYTIYQSPLSVRYLEQLIASSDRDDFYVLQEDSSVIGYYHAVHDSFDLFLNYIAVSALARGKGLGTRLLKHFELNGISKQCRSLSLEVFEKNVRVVKWYLEHDYRDVSSKYLARIRIRESPRRDFLSICASDLEWCQAYSKEKLYGFSKIECRCGNGYLTVGLIGGNSVKLLTYEGVSLEDAINALVGYFHDTRTVLILTLNNLMTDVPYISVDKTIRLSKAIG